MEDGSRWRLGERVGRLSVETVAPANSHLLVESLLVDTQLQAYGKVDEDGSRWLLGDHVGRLWLLVLGASAGRVTGLRLEALGSTSLPSTLSYLDNGVV